jgi:hypothetical protein
LCLLIFKNIFIVIAIAIVKFCCLLLLLLLSKALQ